MHVDQNSKMQMSSESREFQRIGDQRERGELPDSAKQKGLSSLISNYYASRACGIAPFSLSQFQLNLIPSSQFVRSARGI